MNHISFTHTPKIAGIITIIMAGIVTLSCSKKNDHLFDFLLHDSTPVYLFTRPEASGSIRTRVRDEIILQIDKAEQEIVFWFYGFDDPDIADAVLRAKKRGVRLLLTGSSDQSYQVLNERSLDYRLRAKSGLQHAKLLLIDKTILISGSGNFTRSGTMYNDNFFFISKLPFEAAHKIADAMEYEDSADIPVHWTDKTASFRMILSPNQGRTIQSELVQTILRSKHSRILIYSFTDVVLATAMLHAARQGAHIETVMESGSRDSVALSSELHSIYGAAGFSNWQLYADGNTESYYDDDGVKHGGKLHHKMIIADNRILTGSFNYSLSARDSNLETFFEINDVAALAKFHQEFEILRGKSQPIARPPFDSQPLGSMLFYSDGQLCSTVLPVYLFRGSNAFFRGLVFKGGKDSCNLSSASAGFQSSSEYDPGRSAPTRQMPALADYKDAVIEEGFLETLPFHCRSNCDLCATGNCRPIELERISFQSGWLRRSSSAQIQRLFVFHRNGVTEASITEQSGSFLKFNPLSVTSAILFFENESGQIEVGCAASNPAAPLKRLMLAFYWFYPNQFQQPMTCKAPD